jgi:hypothetical protein
MSIVGPDLNSHNKPRKTGRRVEWERPIKTIRTQSVEDSRNKYFSSDKWFI